MNKISLSPSTLSLMSCMRQYKYLKVDRYGSKDKSLSLDKGDFMHKILEAYYKLKMHGEENIVSKTIDIARKLAIDHRLNIEATEECIAVFKEYVLKYSREDWKLEFVEKPFNLYLFSTEKTEFYLEGKMDLGITAQGKFFPVDHKTGGKLNEIRARSHQFLCYCYVSNVQSIMINRIVFTKTPQFSREIKSFDKDVIDEWRDHVVELCQLLEISQEHDHWAQNLAHCWQCQFHDVCNTRRDMRDFKLKRDYVKVEPYDLFRTKE